MNEQQDTETVMQETIEDVHAAFVQQVQGYVTVNEAANMIGISRRSIYMYIGMGKLLSVRIGRSICVSKASVQGIQRSSVGRLRSRVPIWHTPTERNLQYLWTITVRLRQGQEQLRLRLEKIRADQKHLLPGTVARFIAFDEANPDQLHIVFVWRSAVMPPEKEREATFAALKADLADVVEWETACFTVGRMVMNA